MKWISWKKKQILFWGVDKTRGEIETSKGRGGESVTRDKAKVIKFNLNSDNYLEHSYSPILLTPIFIGLVMS